MAVGRSAGFAQPTAAARGRVPTESTERAIAGATVAIPRLHVTATSDSLGRFSLLDVTTGDHLVVVHRLGFAPVSTVMHFAPGDSVDADFLLVPTVQQLASVDVRGAYESPKLAELYIATSRGAQSIERAGRGRPCRAEVIIDGVPVPEGQDRDFDRLVALHDVAGVEWYSSQAEMPVKYAGTKNACAVLAIWTK